MQSCEESLMSNCIAMHFPVFHGEHQVVQEQLTGLETDAFQPRGNCHCYNSFTYFSPLIFLVYSLHAPTSCLLFLVYILISFYRLSFLSCAALLFMCSLMHSTITHAQSCTVLHSSTQSAQSAY